MTGIFVLLLLLLGTPRNMPLSQHICETRCTGFQLYQIAVLVGGAFLVVFQQDGQLDAELGPTGYIQPLRPSFFCNRQNSGSSWSYNWAALLFFHCRPLHLEWILARD